MSGRTDQECFKLLAEPFDWEEVEIKVQTVNKETGKALPVVYLDSRAVRRRLNQVFGHENWDTEYRVLMAGDKLLGAVCRLSVRLPSGGTVVREEAGSVSDIEPLKGAFSDAIKRVFAALGHDHLYEIRLGRYPVTDNKYRPFSDQVLSTMRKVYEQAVRESAQRSAPMFDVPTEDEPEPAHGNGAARVAGLMGLPVEGPQGVLE